MLIGGRNRISLRGTAGLAKEKSKALSSEALVGEPIVTHNALGWG